MITGYFMMHSVTKAKGKEIGKDTLSFILHKYSSFALPLFFSVMAGFVIHTATDGLTHNIFANAVYLLSEIVPLQMTGMYTVEPTAVAWYLSAMMVSLMILYPLARKTGSMFTRIICPLLVFMLYGILCHRYIAISIIMNDFYGLPIFAGLLRGIAGICAGCMLYDCVKATENYKVSRFGELCFLLAEILSVAFIGIVICRFARTQLDYFTLPFFFILLYSSFGRKSLFSKHFSFNFTKHLSTASLLVYLNHHRWNYFIDSKFPDMRLAHKLIFLLSLTAATCIAIHAACLITGQIWKKLKPFLKKHFVGE